MLCTIQKISIRSLLSFQEEAFFPDEGFNVFSGASGAGKSILMEAILAFFGLGECHAQLLEATIKVQDLDDSLKHFLSLDEQELILTLTKKDKVRYFLNSQQIPKKKITELFSPLIKHLSTKNTNALSKSNLLASLDYFCSSKDPNHQNMIQNFEQSYHAYQQATNHHQSLQEQAKTQAQMQEFLEFEIQKITALAPKSGEYESLLELKKHLSKKEKILQSLTQLQEWLSQSYLIDEFLEQTQKQSQYANCAIEELSAMIDEEQSHLEELEEINPEELLNRLEALSALKSKYGSIEQALSELQKKEQELQGYQQLTSNLKAAKIAQEKASITLKEQTNLLFGSRKKHLESFQKVLNSALEQLKMPQAKLELQEIPANHEQPASLHITLETRELEHLSAGEYNRMRLALLLAQSKHQQHQALIILDEVDANLSGEESQGVAQVLKDLSKHYQIFAISHQPHMPILASKHFLISKQQNRSFISELSHDERIKEIARIISGKDITKEALEFASKRLGK